MLVVIVEIWVKPEKVSEFLAITEENARNSRLEPGIARFDVLSDEKEATHFSLIEVYRDDQAPLRHKETQHYQVWRDQAEPMMAKPRASARFRAISPDPSGW
jgi:(4S)-4-hydroxy-5-phosphonooxypentane-2,3-dione isomerase